MSYLSYDLQNDEELLMLRRRHPWALSGFLFKLCLVWIPLWFLLRMFQDFTWGKQLIFICILASIAYAVYHLWVWLFNVFILTDQKLVDIHQRSAFRRTVTESELTDVAEVRYEINGFWGTLLKFGEVIIKLENGGLLVLEQVARPEVVHDRLIEAKKTHLKT